jgi:hypothetical protein
LIAASESVWAGEAFQQERSSGNDDGSKTNLDATRRSLRARQVKVPAPMDSRTGSSLPSGLRIVPAWRAAGEELLGRLYELVRMASEDLEAVEELLAKAEA